MSTASLGRKTGKKTHIRCRRCGLRAYHMTKKRCASCGYGALSKTRKYTWNKKKGNIFGVRRKSRAQV